MCLAGHLTWLTAKSIIRGKPFGLYSFHPQPCTPCKTFQLKFKLLGSYSKLNLNPWTGAVSPSQSSMSEKQIPPF